MKENNIKLAVNYISAIQKQQEVDNILNIAIQAITPDNQIISLVSEEYQKACDNIFKYVIGDQNFDWISWWIYETNFGKAELSFFIDDIKYNPTKMDVETFLNLVWSE